ncbi:hypothetical protein HL42_3221 [Trichophyton rubrum]|nr:hypothetical protein HL42_3221 [Trichophyton rubrum]
MSRASIMGSYQDTACQAALTFPVQLNHGLRLINVKRKKVDPSQTRFRQADGSGKPMPWHVSREAGSEDADLRLTGLTKMVNNISLGVSSGICEAAKSPAREVMKLAASFGREVRGGIYFGRAEVSDY